MQVGPTEDALPTLSLHQRCGPRKKAQSVTQKTVIGPLNILGHAIISAKIWNYGAKND
jgi:hypothetical protein